MTLTDLWHNFCVTTGIKAFSFLYHAKSFPERVLWVTTLTAGIGLTIWDVSTTIGTFMENPTATKVTVVANRSLNVENLVICPVQTASAIRSDGFNVADKQQVAALLIQFQNVNLTGLFESELAKTNSSTSDSIQTNSSVIQMLKLITLLLINLMQVELVEDNLISTNNLTWGFNDGTGESLQMVHKYYQTTSQNYRKMLKLISSLVWCISNLQIISADSRALKNHCRDEYVSWFAPHPYDMQRGTSVVNCLKINPEYLTFVTTRDGIVMGFDFSQVFDSQMEMYNYGGMYIGWEPSLTGQLQNLLHFQHGFSYLITIRMVGHYKSTSATNCTRYEDGRSKFECLLNCRADYIVKHCGCEPLFTTFLTNNRYSSKLCETFEQSYSRVNNTIAPFTSTPKCMNLTKHSVRKMCESVCFDPCERKTFQLGSKQWLRDAKVIGTNSTDYTMLWIVVESFVYSQFEETPLLSSKQFMSQLGGNLSFWLGASFLVTLHVIVFLLKLPLDWKKESSSGLDP